MLRRIWPLAVLFAVAAAGLGFLVLHPEGLFNPYSDILVEGLVTQTVFHQEWQAHHRIPLWRLDLLSGAPALTNPQSLYTHPFHILFALFPAAKVVGLVMWLNMLLGGLGAYCAGSVLRLSIPARLLVAVATLFSFKTILAVYAGWLTVVPSVASMPLLFATTAMVIERPSLCAALVAGLAGALALHSGHLQVTYYAVLFLAIWAASKIARLYVAGEHRPALRILSSLLLAVSVSAGLSAYLLAPLAFSTPFLTRSGQTYEFFTGDFRFPLMGLLSVLGPELFGTPLEESFVESWEYVVYFGGVPSLLCIFGAVRQWRRPIVRALVVGLILSAAMAVDSPLWKVLYTFVPGYDLFRLPARVLFVTVFFAFCLAGIGLDEIRAVARTARSRRAVAAFLIGLVAIEGVFWARRYLRTAHPMPAVVEAAYLETIDSGGEPYRIAPLGRSTPSTGTAGQRGLQLISGYDGFNFDYYQRYIDVLNYNAPHGRRAVGWTDVENLARLDMLGALNVRYVVASAPVELPASEYALVGAFADQPQFHFYKGVTSGPVYVYRNERFLSRAFFVSDVRAAADEDAMTREVLQVDVRTTAVAVGAAAGPSLPSPDDRVDVLRSEGGTLDLAAHNANRRFLVISEIWHPGWRARVDGRPVPLHQTDIALQGLWLDPGDHRVELRFWPVGLTLGLAITGATALVVLGLVGLLVAGRGRR